MWSYIIDGLIIAIIVICAIFGIVKGLFNSVLGLISTGVALIVAVFTAKYVSGFLNNTFDLEKLFIEKLATSAENFTLFGQSLPANDVAKFCAWILTVILIFAVIKLVIYILAKLFEKITNNSPTMGKLNRILGFVFGIVKGGAFCIVILMVISLFSEVPVIGTSISQGIANTKIANVAYKYVDDFVDTQVTSENVNDIVNRMTSNK